jgi:hypothetical protein
MKLFAYLIPFVFLTACAVPQVHEASRLAPILVPEDVETREIELGPLVAKMAQARVGIQFGFLCEVGQARVLSTTRLPVSQEQINKAFKTVFESLGYRVLKEADSVFAKTASADLVLGGTLTQFQSNLCYPYSGRADLTAGSTSSVKGSAFVEIDWELYSVSERKVVYRGKSQGSFETKEIVMGGFDAIVLNAVAASLTNLAANPAFHAIAARPVAPAKAI